MTKRRSAAWSGAFALLSIVEFVAYFYLPPSIETFFEKNIVAEVAVLLAIVVNTFLATRISYWAWAASLNIGNFGERKEQCVDWLLGASPRWGRRKRAATATVANTAEGIIGVLAGWPGTSQSAIESAVREARTYLIRNSTDAGLPSVSLGTDTTHCTAMGLFALDRISDHKVLGTTPEELAAKQKLRKALLSAATQDGWAFRLERPQGREDVRLFSTLWAIRALAVTGGFETLGEDVDRVLRAVRDSSLGYQYHHKAQRLCIVALYALVLSELPDEPSWRELRTKELKRIKQSLFKQLRKNTWTETEVFNDPVAKKDYPWIHLSGALALGALAAFYSELSAWETMRLRERWHKAFRNDWQPEGFFRPHTEDDIDNPQIYPTVYYADSLARYLSAVAGRTGDRK